MKNKRKYLLWIAGLFILYISCKKPYSPNVVSSSNSYLVVEGVINVNGPTSIHISRTVNLSAKTTSNPIVDAQVFVESDAGASLTLTPGIPGYYNLSATTLDKSHKYRLHIKTADNQEYLSDYEVAMDTPPVDSIGFKINGNRMDLYNNTHDPNNNTHYYRFDYAETWKFHSRYQSNYVTNGDSIVHRTPDQDVYTCFTDDASPSILLASSAKLKEDVIYQSPLTFITSESEKISIRYSILVNQYALTADAYKFWINLKKNTEQLGSIFDAQPSEIAGNIHNVNKPDEIVVGYISVCSIKSKRIFIDKAQLPDSWITKYPYECTLDSMWFDNPHNPSNPNDVANRLIPLGTHEIPVYGFSLPSSQKLDGYISSDWDCVDCTIRGYKQQPAFWTDK